MKCLCGPCILNSTNVQEHRHSVKRNHSKQVGKKNANNYITRPSRDGTRSRLQKDRTWIRTKCGFHSVWMARHGEMELPMMPDFCLQTHWVQIEGGWNCGRTCSGRRCWLCGFRWRWGCCWQKPARSDDTRNCGNGLDLIKDDVLFLLNTSSPFNIPISFCRVTRCWGIWWSPTQLLPRRCGFHEPLWPQRRLWWWKWSWFDI